MSHPDDEVLVDLALGSGEPEAAAREHLEHCDECLLAVADLRRAASLVARSGTALEPYAGWSAPPAHVWSRVAATVSAGRAEGPRETTPGATSPAATGLGLESLAEAAPRPAAPLREAARAEAGRREAPGSEGPHPEDAPSTESVVVSLRERGPRRRVWPWAVGMAAAGLVVGVVAGRTFWAEQAPAASMVAQAELDTLDTKQPLGEATLVRTTSGVDLRIATSKPLDPGDGYLEVWLINSDGKRMVSVGVMGGGEMGTFPVSQTMLDEGYVVVDISKEHFDNRPEHSGDSLARGRLPA